jgi:1-acyl-sn-glycerol-3-phosphate acyltransferase
MPTTTPQVDRGRGVLAAAGPLRSGARALAMAAWTGGVTQTALVRMRFCAQHERPAIAQRWVQRWASGLLELFGVEQHWASARPPPAERARLVVANHRSPIDIILMLQHFRGSVLARHDLEGWPVMGRAAREGGTIFVDRKDPRSGVKAIREIRRRLQAGNTVIVFPEGTTHAGDEVWPFLGGAFAAVSGLDAEVLPIGIAYDPGAEFVDASFLAHLQRAAQRRKTRVALCVGAPRDAGRDRAALAEDMRRAVQGLVHTARAQLA